MITILFYHLIPIIIIASMMLVLFIKFREFNKLFRIASILLFISLLIYLLQYMFSTPGIYKKYKLFKELKNIKHTEIKKISIKKHKGSTYSVTEPDEFIIITNSLNNIESTFNIKGNGKATYMINLSLYNGKEYNIKVYENIDGYLVLSLFYNKFKIGNWKCNNFFKTLNK